MSTSEATAPTTSVTTASPPDTPFFPGDIVRLSASAPPLTCTDALRVAGVGTIRSGSLSPTGVVYVVEVVAPGDIIPSLYQRLQIEAGHEHLEMVAPLRHRL